MPRLDLLRPLLPLLVLFFVLAGPARADDEGDLVGTWVGSDDGNRGTLVVLNADGTGSLDGEELTWRVWGRNRIRCRLEGETLRLPFQVSATELVLTIENELLHYRRKGSAPPEPGPNPPVERPAPQPPGEPADNPLQRGGGRQNPLGNPPAPADPFVRRFEGDGLVLVLSAESQAYRGELKRGSDVWPVGARATGASLVGSFRVGTQAFEFSAKLERDTLTLETGGSRYVLVAPPLPKPAPQGQPGEQAQQGQPDEQQSAGFEVPPALEGVDQGPAQRYSHAKGYYSFDMPQGWSVAQELPDGLLLNPGLGPEDTLDALIFLNHGQLELAERNQAPAALIERYSADFRQGMVQQGVQLQRAQAKAKPVLVKDVPGAFKEWQGSVQGGQKVRVWLGAIVKREWYMTVSVVLVSGKGDRFLPGIKRVFFSLEPKPPERNPQLERLLAGKSIAKSSGDARGAFSTIYEFDMQGGVKKEMLVSGIAGIDMDVGGSSEEWGSYEIVGDVLYMYFRDGQESGTVVVQGGQFAGVRFGDTLYPAR